MSFTFFFLVNEMQLFLRKELLLFLLLPFRQFWECKELLSWKFGTDRFYLLLSRYTSNVEATCSKIHVILKNYYTWKFSFVIVVYTIKEFFVYEKEYHMKIDIIAILFYGSWCNIIRISKRDYILIKWKKW